MSKPGAGARRKDTGARGVVRMVLRKLGGSGAWVLIEKWPDEEMREVRVSENREALIGMLDDYR